MEWNTSYIFSTVQNKEHFSKIIFLHYILCILLPRTLSLRRDSYILPLVQGGGSIVGWSDLQLFAIFDNGHIAACRSGIFLWVFFPKKWQNFVGCARGRVYIFKNWILDVKGTVQWYSSLKLLLNSSAKHAPPFSRASYKNQETNVHCTVYTVQ